MKLIKHKTAAWIFLLLSMAGFLNSVYLSIKKIFASPVSCFVFENCQNVLDSVYAKILGVPLSFFGVIFYFIVFAVSVRFLETGREKTFKIVYHLALFAVVFAVYLFILQIFIINAFCVYCVFSAVVSLALFITAVFSSKRVVFI